MRIVPEQLEAMKRLHLPTIVGEYGVRLKAAGEDRYLGLCPFHDDKTPSFSVGKRGDKWLWNCFGACRRGGNVIDFTMKKEGAQFGEAYQKLLPKVKGGVLEAPHSTPTASPAPSVAGATAFLSRVVEIYHAAFLETIPARDYLSGRGIKDGALFRHFKVGYADGRLRRMLPDDPGHEFVRSLKSSGILNERGGEFFQSCVTFPIFDENNAVAGMYGRRVTGQGWLPGDGPAHLYLPGPRRGVWNGAAFKAHRDIILTESIIDALSLCALGFANAVPLYGVNGLTEDHLRLMKEHRTAKVFLCLDNDAAGSLARRPTREKLESLGVEVLDVFLPEGVKDVNEALTKGLTQDEFIGLMGGKKTMAGKPMIPESAGSAASSPKDGPSVEEKDGALFVSFGRRSYRVRGLTARNLEHLRVNVKVESRGSEGSPDGNHLDTIDLYSSKARDAFVSCCRKVMKAEPGDLARELNQLIELLENVQAKALGSVDKGDERPLSPEEEAEALKALAAPELLKGILADMESLGYVGEEANKAIGYLVGISRKLEDPLSCVLMSQSSAGKSVLAETVEKMTPPEDVLMLSRLTANSLFYMKRDALKHKLLILEERIGAESADYSIRSLQSKKKLVQAVPVKDEKTGQIETKTFEVEGPIAYIETTSRTRIADDNATRCFELSLDESPEQTRRIHEGQRRARTLEGLEERAVRQDIQRRHWNMQRLLKPVRVVIPYAGQLDFPTTWLRTRRDNVRFLNLIEVVCFLHQRQRPTARTQDGTEYIAATAEDYRTAYDLAGQVMGESLTELKKPQRKLLEAIQSMGPTGDGRSSDGVTRREIRERVGLSDTRLRILLDDLVGLDYLRLIEGGSQGKVCRYRLTDLVEGDERRLPGLTTPEALAARLKAA